MAVTAQVRMWDDDEGWGVVDSDETPGGCWAHVGAVATEGFSVLRVGDAVMLEWEAGGQDGFAYRAVRVWPAGAEPVDRVVQTDSPAYRSTLTITFPDGTTTHRWG